MGQKVNPHGLRVGVIKGWESNWFADKDYEKFLLEDIKIRELPSGQQHRTAEERPEKDDRCKC